MDPLRWTAAALLVAVVSLVPAPQAGAEPAAAPRQAARINDIDGDGKLDVVFVHSGEAADTADDEEGHPGSVQVVFGDGKVQHVSTAQLHDGLFEDSSFGSGLVVGDLNRDGYADVVVADQSAGGSYNGRVWALWGSSAGISARRTSVLATGTQQSIGTSLAFIPLPEPLLAIGASAIGTGFVDLYRVREDGRLGDRRRITIGSPGIAGRAYPEASFGASMAASGDLLVIGAPEAGAIWTAGAAYVLQLQSGLRYWATRVMQGSRGIPGAQEKFDAFGQAVSVLDDRVAIGVPGEQLGANESAGAIELLRVERTGHGLRIHPGALLTQASPGVPGDVGENHLLGENVFVTRLCAQGYGVITADHGSDRLLTIPFSAGRCSAAWLTPERQAGPVKLGPPPASILRRLVAGTAVDEPVVVADDFTLQIGWPGSMTETGLRGRIPGPVRLLAPPAA
ncbi:MAG TPA: VCBS repeat-containing protein [Propionicimonas sp.]|uniref:FG-GAP repeat domain-containing protein n=1 Tax=Propionicimonas sp. TaxID=1955623 RepID=UPI002F422351